MTHFWVSGELTGGELWMAMPREGLAGIVRSIIRRNSAVDVEGADPTTLRLAAAIAIGEELQARLIDAAIKCGKWSYATASSSEIATLKHARGETLAASITWPAEGLPLVFVPTVEGETAPSGRVFDMRWETDRDLLKSLLASSFIQGGLI
ncbi:hypothetical protein ABIB15_002937 [Marisediminicola sp. UYEF4]|uniref:hypothetical protein n=1 Tax=Marisediminicola sp. UYEF4 TaxID=1756384 RepID=UPI0033936D40